MGQALAFLSGSNKKETKSEINSVDNRHILQAIEKQSRMTNDLLSLLLSFFKSNNRSDKELALDIQKILIRRT